MNRRFGITDALIYLIILVFTAFCVVPMLLVIMVSFTDEAAIQEYGYSLFPEKFSLEAYGSIFRHGDSLVNSYLVSILVTAAGTLIAITITAMVAYTLANKQVRYRNALAFYFFVTMVFHAGIVPWYIMCGNLGLKNNILSLIVPSLMFNAFDMFLVRNFMNGIPDSLMESAKIDGAGDATIAFKIYFPLCMPVLAAVTLFYALGYWNNWFNAIMLVDNKKLFPLQYLLFKLQSEIQMLSDLQDYGVDTSRMSIPTESLKMATSIITIGPIVFLYPFLQRYFIKGLIIGSVKG